MEGKFITRDQRNKLVHEVKKTHFTLGNYEKDKQMIQETVPQLQNSNFLSLGMRATNFELGKDKPVKKSEFHSRFVPHEISPLQFRVKNSTVDSRKTHYTLGTYTETPKPFQSTPHLQKLEPKYTAHLSGMHHFKYGTDSITPKSISAQDFVPKQVSLKEKEETDKLKAELQKSHFGLGSEAHTYLSTNKASYTAFTPQYEKKSENSLISHFQLGTDKANYETTAASKAKSSEGGKPAFNEAHLKDLRVSHFAFGSKTPEYLLSSQQIVGGPIEKLDKSNDLLMKKSNLKLGTTQKPWSTTYEQTHLGSEPVKNVTFGAIDDKNAHFQLGCSAEPYTSVHRSDFKVLDLLKNEENKQSEFVRQHHYKLGNQRVEFKSQNEKYGQGKAERGASEAVGDWRKSNFCLGNDKVENTTVNRESFQGLRGSQSSNNMKIIPINLGEGKIKLNWDTEQKSRFGWIKPVADNHFKFSFEQSPNPSPKPNLI